MEKSRPCHVAYVTFSPARFRTADIQFRPVCWDTVTHRRG